MSDSRVVFVEAPSRLHMGLIDLRGDFGRRFGGIGAALEAPSLLLEARLADRLSAEDEAFRNLPPPPAELGGRVAQLILMVVLPALVEEDLATFGLWRDRGPAAGR